MSKNLIKDVDYYTDPSGNFVFTEAYHIAKGYCCGHGCRHCPYDPEWTKGTTKIKEKESED